MMHAVNEFHAADILLISIGPVEFTRVARPESSTGVAEFGKTTPLTGRATHKADRSLSYYLRSGRLSIIVGPRQGEG
jgi:hypothetical protein